MKPPDPFVLFLDRSLGKQIVASTLSASGYQVEVHDNHFLPNARDEQWLSTVGRNGWVILTKDKRIKHRALELAAIISVKARVFTLSAGSLQGQEMAEIFVKAMPQIKDYVDSHTPPYIVSLTKNGKLSPLYP